eukprot:GHUV01044471.1.p1 GENE.GHUV01044471.1~~GHUV01044471.1.p1  ORF type:complete len:279 (+),score=66.96 GHUV01044471.1:521-1357(+)
MRRWFQPAARACNLPVSQAHQVRVLTYNILADKYKRFHPYCPPEYLDWSYRYPRILQELQSYSPDILCLQEVEQTVYDSHLQPWMQQQGYCSLYQPRRTPPSYPGPDEGVSLHYRPAVFSALAHQALRFADSALVAQLVGNSSCSRVEQEYAAAISSTGSQPSSSDSPTSRHPGVCRHHKGEHRFFRRLMSREEGCVMALLQHNTSQQLMLACSTHLFSNPLFPDVKVAQAAVLCHSIAQFLQQQGFGVGDVGVMIGGDFNSQAEKYVTDKWDQVGGP